MPLISFYLSKLFVLQFLAAHVIMQMATTRKRKGSKDTLKINVEFLYPIPHPSPNTKEKPENNSFHDLISRTIIKEEHKGDIIGVWIFKVPTRGYFSCQNKYLNISQAIHYDEIHKTYNNGMITNGNCRIFVTCNGGSIFHLLLLPIHRSIACQKSSAMYKQCTPTLLNAWIIIASCFCIL